MKRRGREEGEKDGGKANIKVRQEEQGWHGEERRQK